MNAEFPSTWNCPLPSAVTAGEVIPPRAPVNVWKSPPVEAATVGELAGAYNASSDSTRYGAQRLQRVYDDRSVKSLLRENDSTANTPVMQARIDGVRIGYDDEGTGIPMVLLHGFPLDRTIWEEQAARLAQRARVIRVDLRGAGESMPGEGPALMETLAGDVAGLLDHLKIERAIICGHAFGGYVALAFF